MTRTPTLAVLVKGWPRLSETFIAQELVALEQAGIAFELWSLRHPTDTKTHPLHARLQAPVRYLPEYIYDEPDRVAAARVRAQALPGYKAAYAVWRADLRRDPTHNRIRRFGQACVLATEMHPETRGFYAHFLHTPSSVARYAAIMHGLPWSFSAHAKDIWTSPDWELREKLSAQSHGATFGVTCTGLGAAHLRQLSDDPARVGLVYHGLDLGRFPKPPERRLRSSGARLNMLSVGRLVPKKGFEDLLHAFALLPSKMAWHWTHIGGGPLAQMLQAQAQAAGLAEQLSWRGACDQPEVIEAMRASDLFVLPSRVAEDGDRDGLPNVLMEAASQRLPILSTPVSAIPEFITHGVHGTLAEHAPKTLADAILKIAQDPAAAERMALAAETRLRDEFDFAPGIAEIATRLRALIG